MKITDAHGDAIAQYMWNELGQMDTIEIGNMIRISNTWDLKGLASNTASLVYGNVVLYSEQLEKGIPQNGADGLAYTEDMGTMDGRVTREVRTRGDREEIQDYGWKPDGKMSRSTRYVKENGAYVKDESESEAWSYYFDGGPSSRTRNGVTNKYYQRTGSHMVDHVTGALPNGRDASAQGSFQYDLSGNLVLDNSRASEMTYGEDGRMVVQSFVNTMDSMWVLHDFSGNRVGNVVCNGKGSWSNWYVELGGIRRAEVGLKASGTVDVVTLLRGVSSAIGRRNSSGQREWFVKDWRGSVVQTVEENGLGGYEFRYTAYGERKDLVQSSAWNAPSFQWTGKELDERTGLYYFGARWWDPELGVWLGADPAGQFSDPYTFGGDPVNGVDRDGRCLEPVSFMICVAVAAGAYMGGAAANHGQLRPWEWKANTNTAAGMLGGAILGGASGGLAAGGIYALGAGSAVLGSTMIGAGGLSYVATTAEGINEIHDGTGFNPLEMTKSWGMGAAVGAAGGAMIGASIAGGGFMAATAPGLPLSNGVILGGGTLAGGSIGSGVGAYYDQTAMGTLRGGGSGALAGSAVVGAAYAVSLAEPLYNELAIKSTVGVNGLNLPSSIWITKVLFGGTTATTLLSASYYVARGDKMISDINKVASPVSDFVSNVGSDIAGSELVRYIGDVYSSCKKPGPKKRSCQDVLGF